MKIKIEGQNGIESVESYIDHCMDSNDYYAGTLEQARDKANNTARALGRLCEILLDKRILTLDDLHTVSGGYKHIQGVTE